MPDQLQPRLRAAVRQHQRGPGHDGQLGHRERPARPQFGFVQPTYPGDPNGQNDPNPAAHEASQTNPVGGPDNNPLPPACSPELPNTKTPADALDGTQCPANKLVITPSAPIGNGSTFTVTVRYTGRPGVHNDGDGTTEGWFRAPGRRLRDHRAGRLGGLDAAQRLPGGQAHLRLLRHGHRGPDRDRQRRYWSRYGTTRPARNSLAARSPGTGTPPRPIASYLVEDSVGNYSLTSRTVDGIPFYQAQDTSISAAQQQKNAAIMDMQPDITAFESQFNGPYPFISDGVIIGTPSASFDEEMQTMIAFSGGAIDTDTLYHENMHQWWGDNVTEDDYHMTFYKEGLATLAEFLYHARLAEDAAGGPSSRQGQAAFEASLVNQFNTIYRSSGSFWTTAPSNPEPFSLFSGSTTYDRPGAAYIALRQILGPGNFDPGAAATPAHLRRGQHHRAAARSRLPPVAAGAQQRLPGAAEPVLHPVVRHRLPGGRRRAPAHDHRTRPGRPRFLQRSGSVRLGRFDHVGCSLDDPPERDCRCGS